MVRNLVRKVVPALEVVRNIVVRKSFEKKIEPLLSNIRQIEPTSAYLWLYGPLSILPSLLSLSRRVVTRQALSSNHCGATVKGPQDAH